MIEEIHSNRGAGFEHLRDLLPFGELFAINRRKWGKGGHSQTQLFPEENATNIYAQEALEKGIVEKGDARGKGRKGKGAANAPAVDKSWMSQMLAEKLKDERNLAFYKFVVRRLPEHLIRDALTRALDTPLRNIRRSRGALFASILSPHLKTRRDTKS